MMEGKFIERKCPYYPLTIHNRHCDLRGNLIKAMMMLNWLAMLDVEQH